MRGEDFFKVVGNHWSILLFIGGMIMTWGVYSNRIDNIETRINTVEERQGTYDKTLSDMSGDIREIKTTLIFIDKKLP